MTKSTDTHATLLFDGVCNMCNGFVQFVLLRDKAAYFRFASLQSELGEGLLKQHGLDTSSLSTVVLIENNQVYTHSEVVIRVGSRLGVFWSWVQVFRIIPVGFRDQIYNWVARNRYHWFGKRDQCMLPKPEWRDRFLA